MAIPKTAQAEVLYSDSSYTTDVNFAVSYFSSSTTVFLDPQSSTSTGVYISGLKLKLTSGNFFGGASLQTIELRCVGAGGSTYVASSTGNLWGINDTSYVEIPTVFMYRDFGNGVCTQYYLFGQGQYAGAGSGQPYVTAQGSGVYGSGIASIITTDGNVPPTDSVSRIYSILPAEGSQTASSTFGFSVCAIRGTDFESPVFPGQFLYPQIRIHFNPLESVYAGPETGDYFVNLTQNDGCYYGTTSPPLPTGFVQMTASFYSAELNQNVRATTTQFIVVKSYAQEQNEIYEDNITNDCTTATGLDKIVCGIGSAFTSSFRFVLQPTPASLAQFTNVASSTRNRAPFVYLYQSTDIVRTLFSTTTQATSSAIIINTSQMVQGTATTTIFGPTTLNYINSYAGFNLWSLVYQVMISALYLGGLWSCVNIVRYMHHK